MTQTMPATYQTPTSALGSAQKLLSIEGIRGLLALLVCTGHLGLNTVAGHFGARVEFGLAVDIFFILSGFVLAKSYYFGKRTFGRLVLARIARLYPLHALTLLITLFVFLAASKAVDLGIVLQHAMLIHNIGLPPNHLDLNFPSWSISVEMALSLLFYWVIRRDRKLLYPTLIILGISLGYFAFDGALPPFAFLGAISYSVYLLHMPISFALEFLLPEEAVRGVGKLTQLAVILTAAALTHRFYEIPLQRLILSIPLAVRHRAQLQRQEAK